MSPILERQGAHLAALVALLAAVAAAFRAPGFGIGSLLGVATPTWLLFAVFLPITHQVYVLLSWRLELHHEVFTRRLGEGGFRLHSVIFLALLLSRGLILIPLALSNRGTLPLPMRLRIGLALAAGILSLYVFYSVVRYFGLRRAMGIDHFDPSYREAGLEKRGAFRWVRNPMYTLGFLILWVPGLICASQAALLGAAFQHLYIWVHYFTVEQPDMKHIYGDGAEV